MAHNPSVLCIASSTFWSPQGGALFSQHSLICDFVQGNCIDSFPEGWEVPTPNLQARVGQCLLLFGDNKGFNAQIAFARNGSPTELENGAVLCASSGMTTSWGHARAPLLLMHKPLAVYLARWSVHVPHVMPV